MKERIRKYSLILTLIPLLAVMIMIFCFSAQSSSKSSETSARITKTVVRVTHPDYDRLDRQTQRTIFERTSHLVRKTAHFTEFAMLGFFLYLHLRALARERGLRRPALYTALGGVLYAVSDELHQGFVAGRAPAALDVGIDSVGVLFGLLVMALLLVLCGAKSRRSSP